MANLCHKGIMAFGVDNTPAVFEFPSGQALML